MKQVIWILISLAPLLSCKKKYTGTADMRGYLMDECGSDIPLDRVKIALTYGNLDVMLQTTTDSAGYFHIHGDYEYEHIEKIGHETMLKIMDYGKHLDYNISRSKDLMRLPPDNFNDTLYSINYTNVILTVDLSTPNFGSQNDEVRIRYEADPKESPLSTFKNYYGPFYDGQILDTIKARTFPHIGYDWGLVGSYNKACSYWLNGILMGAVAYPWVSDQPNNACGNYTNVYLKLD